MAQHEEETLDFPYDVFLSFRDEDTREKFIGHLSKALSRKGIITFDKNLEKEESVSSSLSKAFEESRVFIVVFSENYASSTWCLDKLVEILERSKKGDKKRVFPIFYHVDPSDIRNQRNRYGEDMIAHENKFGKDSQRVKNWRSALTEASNFPGEHFTTGSRKYEINLIEEIVDKVYKNIAPKPLRTGQSPIGLEPRIEELKSLLDMKPGDETKHMLGIYGLGGIGKTELAKALYNNIVRDFDSASFIADVREKSNKPNGLEDLQKTLLSEMLEELETEFGSTSKGMYEIKRRLHLKKVLLVLDDVDDKDKLEKLAGGCDWFGFGSRIIITTRYKDVLITHKVEKIYEMKELDEQHSLELFCWNAFKQSHPKTGFGNVSLRAVGFSKRLPLALKVIGSDLATLYEESLDAWECALQEYEKTPSSEKILDVLKISYDRLGENAKQVFLDIACFFKGESSEYVKKIIEEFGASNINVLVNKSLLTIENGYLKMHDLIQDMGREIIRQETTKLGERSRLWYYEDVIEILTDDYGSDNIQGIMLDPPQKEVVNWDGNAFKKMESLRILIVRNTLFSHEPNHLSNHLRVLDWEEYPSRSFPSKFHPKKIIVFNLPRSHLTLEEPFKKFSYLTNINFSYNQSIIKMPDVSEVQNLRELRLDHCKHLITIHDSVGYLKRLAHLSASECTQLKNFPQKMFLPSLEVLNLNLCGKLEHFPEIKEEMNKSLKIYMTNTAIKVLPESIDKLIGLVSIEISNSRKLKYLPSSLFMLPNNVAFKIGGCRQLLESFRSFVQSLSTINVCPILQTLHFENANLSDGDLLTILNCFPKLEELFASKNKFVSLPTCIKECVHLTSLDVSFCEMLQKIPECPNLRTLKVNHCMNLEEISELPFIQKVDARHTSLAKETSDMLWFQAAKGMRELEIVMPQTEIAEWFDFIGNGENLRFWVRCKFPTFALALVFQDVTGWGRQGRHQILQLQLVINGRCVSRRGYKFRIGADHVLICDLRLLFSDEEWLGLDTFLEHEWNVVQVSYEAPPPLILSRWGVHVYEEGANMEHVQFICPHPKYLDMSPTLVPTKEDPKEERRKLIENFCIDEVLEATILEYMHYCENKKDLTDENMELVYSKIGLLKEVSKQAKDELNSGDSDLEDKHSLLTTFLKTYYALGPEIQEEIDNVPQQKEKMRKIFSDGIRDGLLEAKAKFPSLNLIKTRSVALRKGSRVRWLFEELPDVVKLYIGGIISGLSEAKLNFPDFDMLATLVPMLRMIGVNDLHDNFGRPLIRLIKEVSVDLGQEALTRYVYYDGVTDGLYEAQNTFPYLDITETRSVAIKNMAFWSILLLGEDLVRVLRTVETRTYIDGILGGLVEAMRSFPDLDIIKILSVVLRRMGIFKVITIEDEAPGNLPHKDLTLMGVLEDKWEESMDVGEASTSGHQGREEEQGNDPQQEKILREIFYEGITDALVQARSNFPSLDINKTRSAALNAKIYGHRAVWSLSEPEGGWKSHLSIKKKIYIEGVMNGLLEAKLSFPNLDIWATLNTLNSRKLKTSFVTIPRFIKLDWNKEIPPSLGSLDPPLQTSTTMNQQSSKSEAESKFPFKLEGQEALGNKFVKHENEGAVSNKDSGTTSSCKNQYDEPIQKFNTQSDEFVSKKVDCTSATGILMDNGCKCESKYEKVSAILKGRAEELGSLYHARIESFQKSEEFHDLMIATYLNGQRDGVLEAQAILLLPQDMDTKTPVFLDNEEHVIDEVAKNEKLDEDLSVTGIPIPTVPDVPNDNANLDTNNPSGSKEFFNWFEFV
ncbi:uncharacterized protein LOC109789614 [Cajanus cajan]|uniref:TMV resistance protein N n=1 Tax=Cajanus cajan TaxID=3821 RepID=A0A151R6P1_CAJCA|nr:uncharacterized protein LOC109789614 [Cajanus cajan]KYP38156.1 TMV resistance protein N [Cajanus cajan]